MKKWNMMTEEKRINLDWVARGFTEKVIFDQKQKQENKKDPAVQSFGAWGFQAGDSTKANIMIQKWVWNALDSGRRLEWMKWREIGNESERLIRTR